MKEARPPDRTPLDVRPARVDQDTTKTSHAFLSHGMRAQRYPSTGVPDWHSSNRDEGMPVSSPLVRRLRLAVSIRDLRRQMDVTAEQLATMAKLNRLDVSRLENASRRPNTNKVMAVLEAAGIGEDSERWRTLMRISREANNRGWWDEPEFAALGERQRRYADIESGSTWIGLYHNSLMPGPIQTVGYIEARDEAFRREGVSIAPVQGVARLRRQQEIIREGGPKIEVLLEEQVIKRLYIEPNIMAEQLQHLLAMTRQYPQITVRILPVKCSFPLGHVPRTPMALHSFADPDDGTAVLLETVGDDLLLHDLNEVAPYVRLFGRARDAALSEADSAAFIAAAAAGLAVAS